MLPYILAALAGALGGSLATSAITGGGEDTSGTATTQNSYSIQYPTYQIQIDSPLSSQSTTKKASSSTESEASAGNSTLDASSLIPIALIIGGAFVAKELLK